MSIQYIGSCERGNGLIVELGYGSTLHKPNLMVTYQRGRLLCVCVNCNTSTPSSGVFGLMLHCLRQQGLAFFGMIHENKKVEEAETETCIHR